MVLVEKIRGVNFGNWLVLEKWMHPELFAGTTAEDEDELCRQLPREELVRRLTEHRDTYITKDDFLYVREHGMNMVRIPVPHFIFGDDPAYCDPYVPCIEYLDRAFDWAEETGLQILVDLHTAPESQNGFDNGGICGVCKWAQSPERIDRVLLVLEKLAERYGKREGLWGIELLNEPISEQLWHHIQDRYLPHDPQRATGSDFVPLSVLQDFYKRGYEVLRRHMEESKAVVFHDGFRFDAWFNFMTEPEYKNVVLDAHWYLGMDLGSNLEELDFMRTIFHDHAEKIKLMEQVHPVIVGEWCLCHDSQSKRERTPLQEELFFRLVGDAQLAVWEDCSGYFFWSYKLISDPAGWDLRKCIERGWLPQNLTTGR